MCAGREADQPDFFLRWPSLAEQPSAAACDPMQSKARTRVSLRSGRLRIASTVRRRWHCDG